MRKLTKILDRSIFIFFVAIGVFAIMNTTHALSTITPLGGTVQSSTDAKNISDIEKKEYKCTVSGKSFSVKPINKTGKNLDFLVPYTKRSSTGNKVMTKQYFLGLYERVNQTISCIYQGEPPSTTTTTLNRLKLFGTSRS